MSLSPRFHTRFGAEHREAKARGLKHYQPSLPCRNRHTQEEGATRRVSDDTCSECEYDARRRERFTRMQRGT